MHMKTENFLETVRAVKEKEIAIAKKSVSQYEMRKHALSTPPARDFYSALKNSKNEFAVIAEIKQASPTKGVLRENFNPKQLASAYEKGGASCLSVLTEKEYFKGDGKHIREAKEASSLPVLCKDFMISPYQIYQARVWGADCVLLILSLLSDEKARELENIALNLGMSVLIEVRDRAEMKRAKAMQSKLIGVNNRDLKTLEIDKNTALILAANSCLSNEYVVVAESGIESNADLLNYASSGIKSFLIGSALMAEDDVEKSLKRLLTEHLPLSLSEFEKQASAMGFASTIVDKNLEFAVYDFEKDNAFWIHWASDRRELRAVTTNGADDFLTVAEAANFVRHKWAEEAAWRMARNLVRELDRG